MNEVFEFLKQFPFLGDATISAIVVILILTGKLVPRRVLQDTIHERNAWREAYLTEAKATAEVRRQNGELLETAKIAEHLLTSFKERSERP